MDEVVIQVLVRWAVPVFIMISGFLLLDPEKEMDLKKIGRYILRMGAVLLTIGLLYCLMESFASEGFSTPLQTALSAARNLVEGKSWSHMWYVYMLIGLYLLTPLLRPFVQYADKKTQQFILMVLFALTVLRPTLNGLLGLSIEPFIAVSGCYLFYYLAGAYLRRQQPSVETTRFLILGGALGTAGMAAMVGFGIGAGVQPDNVFVALYAVGLFAAAKENSWLEKAAAHPAVKAVSEYSFGLYLFHPFILNVLNKVLSVFPDILPIGIGEAAFYIAAFSGAFALSWILGKVPLVRDIL